MVIQVPPQGTPPDGSFPWPQPEFEKIYNNTMDASFAALGRSITLHLTPQITPDVSGVEASTTAVHYSPFMGRGTRRVPSTISTTRTPAVKHVPRDVTYVAHIKHGPKQQDDRGGVALTANEVQTKTVIESLSHVSEAESATIDGMRYQRESIRPIGLQNKRYILTTWSAIDEKERP